MHDSNLLLHTASDDLMCWLRLIFLLLNMIMNELYKFLTFIKISKKLELSWLWLRFKCVLIVLSLILLWQLRLFTKNQSLISIANKQFVLISQENLNIICGIWLNWKTVIIRKYLFSIKSWCENVNFYTFN